MIFTPLIFCGVAFLSNDWKVFSLLLYAFGFVPLLETLLRPQHSNLEKTQLEIVKADRIYDFLLYLILPIQYAILIWFLIIIDNPEATWWVTGGKILSMGLCCGILGINGAHELGHRIQPYEKIMAKSLLLTSLYMHFFIEHNRGHHKRVSTPEDPASARRGETLFTFWVRSIIGSYLSAWKLENSRLHRKGRSPASFQNEMVIYHLIQGTLMLAILFIFAWKTMCYFLLAATIGYLVLETVNYIEHYGLQRKKLQNGQYEHVRPQHSWNSDHPIGRLLLFELSRHSDHHYRPGRKYQTLRHINTSPQMPTGYPGMMILALFPPIWFHIMHQQILNFQATQAPLPPKPPA